VDNISKLIPIEEGKDYKVYDVDGVYKSFRSTEYNYDFRYNDGKMISWGKSLVDDPGRAPVPNILDMEISTICRHNCPFCYKSNNPNGKNMSFDTFKRILDVQSKGLTQIALGSDYTGMANPDVLKMMDYAREHNVIPNITVGYVSDETADEFAKRVGAIAISVYEDKNKAYDSVKRMTDRGIKQTNIHFMIAEETYDRCMEVLNDITTDERLKSLNAIVLLSLKTKGRGIGYHPLSQDKLDNLCKFATEHKIGLGFDSCSSLKAIRALGESVKESVIPCEASRESSYINVEGYYYPCSFMEKEYNNAMDWTKGINVLECNSTAEYLEKVWNNQKTLDFKDILDSTCNCNEYNCRTCLMFKV